MQDVRRYFEIKSQIKELTVELKALEPSVFDTVSDEDNCKLTTDFAGFQVVYRPKWKYSNDLLEKEKLARDVIKVKKKKEEIEGIAEKLSDGGQLRMTGLKK